MRDWRRKKHQRIVEFPDGECLVAAILFAPVEVLRPLSAALDARRVERSRLGLECNAIYRPRYRGDEPRNATQVLELVETFKHLPSRPACSSLAEFVVGLGA